MPKQVQSAGAPLTRRGPHTHRFLAVPCDTTPSPFRRRQGRRFRGPRPCQRLRVAPSPRCYAHSRTRLLRVFQTATYCATSRNAPVLLFSRCDRYSPEATGLIRPRSRPSCRVTPNPIGHSPACAALDCDLIRAHYSCRHASPVGHRVREEPTSRFAVPAL
jgi:hypothetical protein